jgi:hypothetical protein
LSRPLQLLLVIGSSLAIFGSIQLLLGWHYAGIVTREATAVGTIRHISHGKHTSYEYTFSVGSLDIRDTDSQCETALTRGACEVGTPVLVYYDRMNPISTTLLNDFGAESRRDVGLGKWMTPIGLILLIWFYLVYRSGRSPDSEGQSDDSPPHEDSDVLHVVPNKNE